MRSLSVCTELDQLRRTGAWRLPVERTPTVHTLHEKGSRRARGRPQSSCPDPGPTVGAGDVSSPFQLAADARIMCTPAAVARALRSKSSLPSAEDATPLSSVPSSAQHGGMAASMASIRPATTSGDRMSYPRLTAANRTASASRAKPTSIDGMRASAAGPSRESASARGFTGCVALVWRTCTE